MFSPDLAISPAPNRHIAAQFFLFQQSTIESVIQVMTVISDLIRQIGHLRLQRRTVRRKALGPPGMFGAGRMLHQSLAHLPRKIKSRKARILLLQFFHYAQTLVVVLETAMAFHQPVQRGFTIVPEW